MSTTDQTIEAEIIAKGKTAPRVTPASIEAVIKSEHYFTAADGAGMAGVPVAFEFWHSNGHAIVDYSESTHVGQLTAEKGYTKTPLHAAAKVPAELGLLTFCVLVMRNGFTVVGKSACASPENFDAELGKKIARQDAINQVWPLEGYLLKQMLHQAAIGA